jgi:hypothetical protein
MSDDQVELFAATRRADFKSLVESYERVTVGMGKERVPCDGRTRKGPCSFRASYCYAGVQPRDAYDDDTSGAYCWSHLVHVGIYGDMKDAYEFETWAAKR